MRPAPKPSVPGFGHANAAGPNEPALAEAHATVVARACRLIEQAEEPPTLDDLAQAAGMSRFHFHRVFKAVTGVTPKAYAAGDRAKRVREELASRDTVTQAIYGAGFNSNGRFYAAAPESARHDADAVPQRWRRQRHSLCRRRMLARCDPGRGDGQRRVRHRARRRSRGAWCASCRTAFPRRSSSAATQAFEQLVAKVVGFVEAPAQGLDLPLDIRGTAFQQRVWQALRDIPAGATASYRDIAKRIGAPKAVRAVAQACAANAIAVAIPCHRVVRTDGSISGYRWGVARKRALLAREKAA